MPEATRAPLESIYASITALFGLVESVVVKRDKILAWEMVNELVIVDEDNVLKVAMTLESEALAM